MAGGTQVSLKAGRACRLFNLLTYVCTGDAEHIPALLTTYQVPREESGKKLPMISSSVGTTSDTRFPSRSVRLHFIPLALVYEERQNVIIVRENA